jgi:hypothetical protein
MNVLIDLLLTPFKRIPGCALGFHAVTLHAFDETAPAFWVRVLIVEATQIVLALTAALSAPRSLDMDYNNRVDAQFRSKCYNNTIAALCVNMISWPFFVKNMRTPPQRTWRGLETKLFHREHGNSDVVVACRRGD